MYNKLARFVRQQNMVEAGDTVICAVSGGTDSIAMLFAFYLLKDTLKIQLEAAHFNHQLRGAESDRDEAFVREFCQNYDIPLHVGTGTVTAGKKGLEAAARDARYAFLNSLDGKIATAHTADDNAETVLMHMLRGTGLKGLGGIAPIRGKLIRPMLTITREEAEAFLEEWGLSHIEDSSNETDAFLRNRLRHHVMPLLKAENPRLAETVTRMALNLREDEEYLSAQANFEVLPTVAALKEMPKALRRRCLARFLRESGVKEPEDAHIAQAEALLYADSPSARASFPGGVTIARQYDRLAVLEDGGALEEQELTCPGEALLSGYRVVCFPAEEAIQSVDTFTVVPEGRMVLRSRKPGDTIRLPGGTKSLKKLFIDRKIPAAERNRILVLCDDQGILGVCGIGADAGRMAQSPPGVTVWFEKIMEHNTEKRENEHNGTGY